MFRKDQWPFTPQCLSEIIDRETLAVIESGCCERIQRPLTVLDIDLRTSSFTRIESIDECQRYEAFCQYLRRDDHWDQACEKQDIDQAKTSLQAFKDTGDPFRIFSCYMGLKDMTHIIRIQDRPVALAFSGQFCPLEGADAVQKAFAGAMNELDLLVHDLDLEHLRELATALPPTPEHARQLVEREAGLIQRIAEAEYARIKRQWEQEFLDDLRQISVVSGEPGRVQFQSQLSNILERVRRFCRCEYGVFFGSTEQGDTLLAPQAYVGIPAECAANLPHFNWKKVGLSLVNFDANRWDIFTGLPEARHKGLRGDNTAYFAGAACILPVSLGDRYRGVLVLGPFTESVDIRTEQRFLVEVAGTVGLFALTGLEVLDLEQERRSWESTATLLAHQLRTALTPVTALIGRTKIMIEHPSGGINAKRVTEFLKQAEDLTMNLAQGAKETLRGHVQHIEADDLEFVSYPLSVLVGNCTSGFVDVAREQKLELVVDNSIEFLPYADVDVPRLTIALANLIDNAIKYAFPETKVYVRSHLSLDTNPSQPLAVIEVDNLGLEIRADEQQYIFERGTRGVNAIKAGRTGTGFGLWETSSIIRAHSGMIHLNCTPTNIHRRDGWAHRVVFAVEIPLRQKRLLQGG